MGLSPASSLPFSVHRSFVVEIHADADLQARSVIGRVEHVVSGQTTLFESLDALIFFMAQILSEARDSLS